MEKLAGTISQEDAHDLEALLREDPELSGKWADLQNSYAQDAAATLPGHNAEEAWKAVERRIVQADLKGRKRRRRWVAAAVLLPLMAGVAFFFRHQRAVVPDTQEPANHNVRLYTAESQMVDLSHYDPATATASLGHVQLNVGQGHLHYTTSDASPVQQLNTLVVPATKTYAITLSDGTEVTLNALSRLKFPFQFSGEKREVWVEGEAYFEVAQDEQHPFIVHTALTRIQVLGTAFNVQAYDSLQVETALVAGAVLTASPDGKQVRLDPGKESIYSAAAGFQVQAFDQSEVLSWMRGVYYFRDVALKQLVPVVQRWYGQSVVFDDAYIADRHFTGAVLRDKPLDVLLESLSYTSDIHSYTKNGVVHFFAP